jgi:hypothetical protein
MAKEKHYIYNRLTILTKKKLRPFSFYGLFNDDFSIVTI